MFLPEKRELKFVLNPDLSWLTTGATLNKYKNLPVSVTEYDTYKGFVLTTDQVKKFEMSQYALPDVRTSLLTFLAEGNESLVQQYLESCGDRDTADNTNVVWLYNSLFPGLNLLEMDSEDFQAKFQPICFASHNTNIVGTKI